MVLVAVRCRISDLASNRLTFTFGNGGSATRRNWAFVPAQAACPRSYTVTSII